MTPKEKAKELIDKYYNVGDQEFDYSKECALIAVEEVINILPPTYNDYWEQVKDEIKKL